MSKNNKETKDDGKYNSTAIITDESIFELHLTGENHPETSQRIQYPLSLLKKEDLPNVSFVKPKLANDSDLLLCHSQNHIDHIRKKAKESDEGIVRLYEKDIDVKLSRKSDEVARYAVGSVLKAVDSLSNDDFFKAFCLIRPPGHHASKEKSAGFCLYNNIAVGVQYALTKYSNLYKKILIIDWDLHHGNGTQSIFKNNSNVYFFSVHLENIYPHNTTEESIQSESINNNNISSAIDGKTEVFNAFDNLEKKMKDFNPDLIFISSGFDGHAEEKIVGGGLGLIDDDYVDLTQMVISMAKKYCDHKIISVLEGGYNIESLSRSVLAHVKCLCGE